MKFSIVREISPGIIDKITMLNRLADFLGDELSKKDYGAVEEVIMGINCIDPKMSPSSKDFETGLVVYKKYTKAKKFLDFTIKFNYSETIKASTNEVIDIFAKGFARSRAEIQALDIKNFDVERFHGDIENLLQDRAWLHLPHQEKVFQYQQPQGPRAEFSQTEKMPIEAFWSLIEKARIESGNILDHQIEIIVSGLSKKDEKEITGFECTLRELLIKANHYNVMAVQKIMEGDVSDDSFLYFRAKLILYGRITFENAINNPNYLFERIDPMANGEALLLVADKAFNMKFGENTDKLSPRDYASEVIDYNLSDYPVQGKEWDESDIPKRYSKLWKLYR